MKNPVNEMQTEIQSKKDSCLPFFAQKPKTSYIRSVSSTASSPKGKPSDSQAEIQRLSSDGQI